MIFKSYISKVKSLIHKGKEEEAMKILLNIERKKPNNVDLLIGIARLYLKMGNLNDCKKYLNRVLELKINEKNIKEILEITNWFMLSSFKYFNNWFSFSSDGNKIVFTSARRDTNNDGRINIYDKSGIYIINSDGTNEQYIISDEYYNSQVVFSPSGDKIAYLSARRDTNRDGFIDHRDNAGLYIADLNKGTEEQLISDEHKVKNISFSPTGESILFTCWFLGSKASGIYTINLKTKEITTIIPSIYESTFPSFSPDRKKIVFSAWRQDTDGDGEITIRDKSAIYIFDIETRLETPVTDYRYDSSFPIFTPDGKKILYLSIRRDTNKDGFIDALDNSNVCLYDLKTRKEKIILPDTQYNKFVSFTNDGNGIVVLSSWGGYKLEHRDKYENKGIYYYNLKNKKVTQIVCEKYYGCRSPQVSSKNEVAYLSWRKGVNRGLFLAYLFKLPTKEQLKSIVEKNL